MKKYLLIFLGIFSLFLITDNVNALSNSVTEFSIDNYNLALSNRTFSFTNWLNTYGFNLGVVDQSLHSYYVIYISSVSTDFLNVSVSGGCNSSCFASNSYAKLISKINGVNYFAVVLPVGKANCGVGTGACIIENNITLSGNSYGFTMQIMGIDAVNDDSIINNNYQNFIDIINNQKNNTQDIIDNQNKNQQQTNSKLDDLNNKQDQTNNKLDDVNNALTNETENSDGTCRGVICNLKKVVRGVIDLPKNIINLMINALKSLFIPDNMDFINNFVNSIETKLGFIAEIPMSIINFTLNLANATWEDVTSVSFPSIDIFGYRFWNSQQIDITEGLNIFKPFKYVTDCLCVALLSKGLFKCWENFTGGGKE